MDDVTDYATAVGGAGQSNIRRTAKTSPHGRGPVDRSKNPVFDSAPRDLLKIVEATVPPR